MTAGIVSKKEAFSGVLDGTSMSLRIVGDCGVALEVDTGVCGQMVVHVGLALVVTEADAVSSAWLALSAGLEGWLLTGLVQTSSFHPVCNLILSHMSSRDLRSFSFPCNKNHHLYFPDRPGCVLRFTFISLTKLRLETVQMVFLTT